MINKRTSDYGDDETKLENLDCFVKG